VVAYPDIAVDPGIIKAPLLSRTYAQRFRIGGAKLTLDGSPQGKTRGSPSRTSRCPRAGGDYRGYAQFKDEQANGFVDLAFRNGWQLLAHVNGDAAADQFIAAVRLAARSTGWPISARWHPRANRAPGPGGGLQGTGHRSSFFRCTRSTGATGTATRCWAPSGPSTSLHRLGARAEHDLHVAPRRAGGDARSLRVISATVTRATRSGQVLARSTARRLWWR